MQICKKNAEICKLVVDNVQSLCKIRINKQPHPYMPAQLIELKLRDFPADVQDYLKQRAVNDCLPMEVIIKGYILETAELIGKTQKGGK